MEDRNGIATVRELSSRYGLTATGMRTWLNNRPHLQPVDAGNPRRYRIADVDAARDADSGLPPGMGTTADLARAVGRHQATITQTLHYPDAPQPAGHARPRGAATRPYPYYPVAEFVAWFRQLRLRGADRFQVGADVEERIAPEKSPHGSEYRYKRLRCGCPVCQSARAAARARARGVADRVSPAVGDLARILLNPAVDADKAAAAVAALAHPERIRILRLVASAWPDPVPRAALRRLLGGEYPEHFRYLTDAGLLSREHVIDMGRRVDAYRFVKTPGERVPVG